MEQYKQLKVRLLVSLVFAVFFGVMLIYFIIDKNLWMCIAMAFLVIACCGKSIKLYKKIKDS
jgi:membrane protein YdbS with pleckstrin-like domain